MRTFIIRMVLAGAAVMAAAPSTPLASPPAAPAAQRAVPKTDGLPGERVEGRALCQEGACRTDIIAELMVYKPDPAKFPVRRTAWDGKPDLNGVYYPVANLTRPPVPLESLMRPEVKARAATLNEDLDAPELFCAPDVPSTGMGRPHPVQLFHTPGFVVAMVATMGTHRIITIGDGPPRHSPSIKPSFQGDAVGYWEGDTLVVDTTNFNGRGWILPRPSPHSDALHYVERFTRPDSQVLEYAYTVEDPKTLTGRWQGETKRFGMVPYPTIDFDPCTGVTETMELTIKALEEQKRNGGGVK